VLAGTDLSEALLRDPACLVEHRQRAQVIMNMLRLTRDPALGLEIGIRAQLVDFGTLAYAQMSARSMREALSLWIRYSIAVGTTIPISLLEHGSSEWSVVYGVDPPTNAVEWFSAEEIVSMAQSLGPALGGSSFIPREFTFAYPPPPHWERYAPILRCPVRFNAKLTSMRVREPSIDWTLPGHDPEFHEVCLRHLDQTIRQIGHERPISSRLRSLMLQQPATPPSLTRAAAYVGMSPRSLRRHLQRENTGYQQLIDQVRLDCATDLLDVEGKPIKEVSYALGYRNVSAFRRAFKSWTGRTIQQFLAQR
jgi:AraC-like DNA-binding protein